MKRSPEFLANKKDTILDAIYWLLALALFLLLGLFPAQIVEFWGWLMKEWFL